MTVTIHDVEQREEWRTIPGISRDYEVSNLGRVRSYRAHGGKRRLREPRIRAVRIGMHGYIQVGLQVDGGRQKQFSVHGLVAAAFLGPRPDGMQVAHGDGDKTNNRVQNLRYATAAENAADKHLHGTVPFGERNSNRKLLRRQVEQIVSAYRPGVRQVDLAEAFGISQSQVSNIVRGASWTHLRTVEAP